MSSDPFQDFLGVDASAGAPALLGLGPGQTDRATVEEALHRRLAQTFNHPEGRSDAAQRVRRRLRQAAESLLRPAPRPRAARVARHGALTDFDRMVLAVLIGARGWNADSRARLVALAGTYGVTVDGLLKVVAGLCEHARGGGIRREVAHIAGSGRRMAAPTPSWEEAAPQEDSTLEWLARVAPELRDPGPASTVRLSILFGLVTLLAALMSLRVLFVPAAHRPQPPAALAPNGGGPAVAAGSRPAAPTAPPPEPELRLARFAAMPTFLGHALTAEAAQAADDCAGLAAEIEQLARRITVADDPSIAVYRQWEACMQTAGTGWVLISETQRFAIELAIFEALYAASDTPSVTDKLLEALIPPPAARLTEPTDVWRGAWMTGTLARAGASRRLSPSVIERARIQLELALGLQGTQRPAAFAEAAEAWLDLAVVGLADRAAFGPQIFDSWECWIAAQRQLGEGDRFQSVLLDAMELVLASPSDLAAGGSSTQVLGRLLELADFQSSAAVRDRFLAWFDDHDRITSRDLWVTTSILAAYDVAPWFSEDLVLPERSDWMFRRRVADRIRQRWPEITDARAVPRSSPHGASAADPGLTRRWTALHRRLRDNVPPPDADRRQEPEPIGLLRLLLQASRLNEAACLIAAGESKVAHDQLVQLESGDDDGAAVEAGRPARGRPTGPDGAWSLQVEEAGHNIDELAQLLSGLRLNAGTDLGPIDAATFVQMVYHGPRRDLRDQARAILIEQFTEGPNVALEMLGRLPAAPRSEVISETISRYTGRLLPQSRFESWPVDARLALVEHALSILGSPGRGVDRLAAMVAQSYARRRNCIDPQSSLSAGSGGWHQAAEDLLNAWRSRAAAASVDVARIQRRQAARQRLAQGPLQEFVAMQITLLDVATEVVAAEQPALAAAARANFRDSARRRSGMSHVLDQAVEAEMAMGRLWNLQFQPAQPAESGS